MDDEVAESAPSRDGNVEQLGAWSGGHYVTASQNRRRGANLITVTLLLCYTTILIVLASITALIRLVLVLTLVSSIQSFRGDFENMH